MKKTKIILPAIALLAISGAASVTGTVAWFTAASTKTVSMTNVVAVSTSGDLKLKFSNASGCTITTDGEILALEDLRDASINVYNGDVFTANFLDGNVESYTKVADPTAIAFSTKVGNVDDVDVYYCAQVTGEFTLGGVASDSYALMFDARNAKSYLDSSSATIPNAANVYKALRVGMKGADHTVVYAPWAGSSVTYVETTDAAVALGTYSTLNMTSGATATAVADGKYTAAEIAANTTLLDAGIAGGGSSTVQFYIWFEGTDATNCLSTAAGVTTATELVAKTLQLTFYAARLKPAA